MAKRILVFQFRCRDLAADEMHSIIQKTGAEPDEFIVTNVSIGDRYDGDLVRIKAIIIAGSGDNSLTAEHAWYECVAGLVQQAIDMGIPVLGICFGHQFLGRLYGAQVVSDLSQRELGTIEVTVNNGGEKEPIFSGMGRCLYVIAGHNDSVINLPESLEVLASSEKCPVQAFKVKDRPVYGVQFHPELTEKEFQKRLSFYRDYYVRTGEDYEKLLMLGERPTNDELILKNFYSLANTAGA